MLRPLEYGSKPDNILTIKSKAMAADAVAFEAALQRMSEPLDADRAARADPALHTLWRYMDNIIKHPTNPQKRLVRTTNAKFVEVCSVEGGRDAFTALGFRPMENDSDQRLHIENDVNPNQLQPLLLKVL